MLCEVGLGVGCVCLRARVRTCVYGCVVVCVPLHYYCLDPAVPLVIV